MLTTKMSKAINEQIGAELNSAYLYFAMAAWSANNGLKGIGHWLMAQAREEVAHALKLYDYLLSHAVQPEMPALAKPPADFKSPLAVFEQTLKHEQGVTARINRLVDLAVDEKDHATQVFLAWFVTEQVEEEESAANIVNMLKMADNEKVALFMIDAQLGKREMKA